MSMRFHIEGYIEGVREPHVTFEFEEVRGDTCEEAIAAVRAIVSTSDPVVITEARQTGTDDSDEDDD